MAELPPRRPLSVGTANAFCPRGGKKSCIGREIPGDRGAEGQALRDERWNGLRGHMPGTLGHGGLDTSGWRHRDQRSSDRRGEPRNVVTFTPGCNIFESCVGIIYSPVEIKF